MPLGGQELEMQSYSAHHLFILLGFLNDVSQVFLVHRRRSHLLFVQLEREAVSCSLPGLPVSCWTPGGLLPLAVWSVTTGLSLFICQQMIRIRKG